MSKQEEKEAQGGTRGAGKKEKTHAARSAAPGVAVAILLALGLGGYGIGTGLGRNTAPEGTGTAEVTASETAGDSITTEAVTDAPSESITESAGEAEEKVLRIEVNEDKILVNGEEIPDLDFLNGILASEKDTTLILVDDRARKETYDAVKKFLEDAKLSFSEE